MSDWAFYKLYGELIEFMGDDGWENYVRHRKISKGENGVIEHDK